MSRWWKCDLQVATPGEPRFRGPNADWDTTSPAGRAAACDQYMEAAKAAGIDVIALADHNSVAWVDDMAAAGERHGIVVFPGFEVTSATGSDGVHLVIFGAPGRTRDELQQLLYGACGFGADHPMFNPSRLTEPAPSPNTVAQILDGLTEDYLAIAPHAFNENGVASQQTVRGTLRWKALHHDRLVAVDVGDFDEAVADANSWKGRFVRRELDDFPRLPGLAFVATSDAYAIEQVGTRFTWIRMETPTLEAMRQAFLDHEARIICDWDTRYRGTGLTPNTVNHAWVRHVGLTGASITPNLEVELDPHLTVLIGGRGSGKSTVVAAMRAVYGDTRGLPPQARSEAEQFEKAVFAHATVRSAHRLAYSEEEQRTTWTAADGSSTLRPGDRYTPTDFKVRVISQKELFERSASSSTNPHATSQNILALVDDEIYAGTAGARSTYTYDVELDQLRTTWTAASRQRQTESAAVARTPQVQDAVEELQRQVAAFDDEANRARRADNDRLLNESLQFDTAIAATRLSIDGVHQDLETRLAAAPVETLENGAPGGLRDLSRDLHRVQEALRAAVASAVEAAKDALEAVVQTRSASAWQAAVAAAQLDSEDYLAELRALGLDPGAYGQIRQQLRDQSQQLADLRRRADALSDLEASENAAWAALDELYERRHEQREVLLGGVAERSGILRFTLDRKADTTSWVMAVRDLLGLRADGFIEDVPELAAWLWCDEVEQRSARVNAWRDACVTGDFVRLAREARLRGPWAARLRELDPLVRTRLAAEVPDEVVTMEFRRAVSTRSDAEHWETLTSGSPGQRSAAMLSFVLHHGDEPLVLDQPEDDLDTEWITQLVVKQLRTSRRTRQIVVVTHNANIPVNADAERVVVLENAGSGVRIRTTTDSDGVVHQHVGAIEDEKVRKDIQQIMEGGVDAFVRRERRYNNELNGYRVAMQMARER